VEERSGGAAARERDVDGEVFGARDDHCSNVGDIPITA
jgi:hypothetical protein